MGFHLIPNKFNLTTKQIEDKLAGLARVGIVVSIAYGPVGLISAAPGTILEIHWSVTAMNRDGREWFAPQLANNLSHAAFIAEEHCRRLGWIP